MAAVVTALPRQGRGDGRDAVGRERIAVEHGVRPRTVPPSPDCCSSGPEPQRTGPSDVHCDGRGPRPIRVRTRRPGGKKFRRRWSTPTEYGNIANAVVLDALGRLLDKGEVMPSAEGLIADHGPRATAETAVGSRVPDMSRAARSRPIEHVATLS